MILRDATAQGFEVDGWLVVTDTWLRAHGIGQDEDSIARAVDGLSAARASDSDGVAVLALAAHRHDATGMAFSPEASERPRGLEEA